ncbi:MAG TPA: hypothetical protein PLQ35_18020, partial [bacterium]|nr:hypothetical protein [bacterium]
MVQRPSFRRKPEPRPWFSARHSGESRNPGRGSAPVIPAKAGTQAVVQRPSFRRKPEPRPW